MHKNSIEVMKIPQTQYTQTQVTDIQVNVYIGSTLLRLSFQN